MTRLEDIDEICGLTPLQQGMLFHTLYVPESSVYNLQLEFELEGDLDESALEQAWCSMVDRFPPLRTSFVWERVEKPYQLVHHHVQLKIARYDWRALSEAEQAQRRRSWLEQDRGQLFDLTRPPLMRLALIVLSERKFRLVWTFHHIILEGWSAAIVLGDFWRLYAGLHAERASDLGPVRPYAEYIHWLQRQDQTKAEVYWRARLRGFAAPTRLPIDRSVETAPAQVRHLESCKLILSNQFSNTLKSLCRSHRITLNTLIQGAWSILLSRYCAEPDVVFGAVVSGRPADLPGMESTVGLFINTLPARVEVDGDKCLIPWLSELQLDQATMRQYEYTPLTQVQGWSEVPRGQPLFHTAISLQNWLGDFPSGQVTSDLQVTMLETHEATDQPLTLFVRVGDRLTLSLAYDIERFERADIQRLLAHLRTLLEGMAAHPQARVRDLPLLTETERDQLLVEWNATQTDAPACPPIHELFEVQAARTPEHAAVVFGERRLTYRELNQRANDLAHQLKRRGVRPEVLVGLFVERSLELLIGVLGILKAGAAYVPLDPDYPKERLGYILEDSQAPIVVTQQSLVDGLPSFAGHAICLDALSPLTRESENNPSSPVNSDHLAYVLFTSGSTGRPKGVALEHRTAATFIQWAQTVFTPQELAGVLFSTSACFDLSVFEIFVPLSSGGTIILVRSALELRALPAKDEVTLINTVPSAMAELLRLQAVPASVTTVNLAGEALPDTLVEQIYATTNVEKVYNLYGPTEATTYSTYTLVRRGDLVTIGRPIANTQCYILDAHRQPVPVGVMGELYVAGGGLARGYYGRPELTNERFVPNPFSEKREDRMYRTGDLCRWLPDGNIQYVGRTDHQVKLRGFRIELGEIEAILAQHPGIRQNVVVVREDEPGRKQLVAYVVPESSASPRPGELREYLKQRLPEFMVPHANVVLEALPLTPNGKINRKALPRPDWSTEKRTTFAAPQTENEKILADIWSQVLRVERVGVHDTFFELGGDSILSIQVIAKAKQAGLRITLRQMLQHQTIAELALVAEKIGTSACDNGPVTGEVPLTPIQHWFFEQDFTDPHHWNQAVLLELRHNLEPAILEQATRQLLIHHDALRLRFCRSRDGWQQWNAPPGEMLSWTRFDLKGLSDVEQRRTMQEAATTLHGQLNLSHGPLLRFGFFDLEPPRHNRLLMVIHHLAVDAVSWRILLEDLQVACDQLKRGEAIKLPPKTNAFKRWAQRLTQHARTTTFQQEADYWLAGAAVASGTLPVDFPQGRNSEASRGVVSVTLDSEDTRALLQIVPQAYSTQINDVLLSALALALSGWIGQPTVRIDLEGHGREDLFEDVDLSRTVGWFTTIFPLRLDLRGLSGAGDVLKSVKEQVRHVPQRGITYGLLKYLNANTDAAAQFRAMPQPEVMFNYLGRFDLPATSPFTWVWDQMGQPHSPKAHRSHLLEINSWVDNDRLRVDWTYSQNVHRRQTIERLATRFLEELCHLIGHCMSTKAHGYTPSDFAEAGLTQEELDRLISDLDEPKTVRSSTV